MNNHSTTTAVDLTALRNLLAKRVSIIADHAFRDRDPAAHLDELKSVSIAIDSYRDLHFHQLDARLRHYLTNASYQKALDWISPPQ
jgi:hypothetical protein